MATNLGSHNWHFSAHHILVINIFYSNYNTKSSELPRKRPNRYACAGQDDRFGDASLCKTGLIERQDGDFAPFLDLFNIALPMCLRLIRTQ
jgi:hypothetical protein